MAFGDGQKLLEFVQLVGRQLLEVWEGQLPCMHDLLINLDLLTPAELLGVPTLQVPGSRCPAPGVIVSSLHDHVYAVTGAFGFHLTEGARERPVHPIGVQVPLFQPAVQGGRADTVRVRYHALRPALPTGFDDPDLARQRERAGTAPAAGRARGQFSAVLGCKVVSHRGNFALPSRATLRKFCPVDKMGVCAWI